MVIISQNGHISFRSEEIEYVAHVPFEKTINSLNLKFSNKINIGFKSGARMTVVCKDVNEASEFLKNIIDAMKKD